MPVFEITGPVTITQPGTYVLARDIQTSGTAITIACDNVRIDLNGHSITGGGDPNSQLAAISSVGRSNITVENGSISGFAYGVYLADPTYTTSANNLVQDLVVTDCTFRGIKIEGEGNIVRNNDISFIGGATFQPLAYAMGIETYGHNGLIANNTIYDVRGYGVEDLGEGVGICLSQYTNGTSVTGNTIGEPSRDMDADYASWPGQSRSSYGVFVGGDAKFITIDDNVIKNYFFGITFARLAGGGVAGNNVTGTFIPYYLVNNDGARVVFDNSNASDQDDVADTYGRHNPGAVETVEADYLSVAMRVPGQQYMQIRNPTVGNETITGTTSRDLVDYHLAFFYFYSESVTVDLAAGTASGWGGQDTLVGIEGVKGTVNNDTLYGATGENLIDGSWGDDLIVGRGGPDFLYGNNGNDLIRPGAGSATVDGGAGFDTVSYEGEARAVISLLVPSLNAGVAAGATYVNVERFILGSGHDIFYGDAGDNDVTGGAGDDVLHGSLGADRLDGGSGFDYARFDDAGYDGLTADLANIVPGTGAAQGDVYLNIEGLVLTTNNDVGYGDGAVNYIYGMTGDDALFGRDGNDHLFGGPGNDVLDGGAGADAFDGDVGADTVAYASAAAGVTANLSVGLGAGGDAEGDTYSGIENLVGSAFADVLVGLAGVVNMLDGGAGDDTIYGEGIDIVFGGAGVDVFFGGQGGALALDVAARGFETVWGSVVGDEIDAGASTVAVVLIGQGGADIMIGGAGDDFFYFDSTDTIAGGAGNDWAVATLSSAGVTLDLAATAIENAWGSTSNDVFNASAATATVVLVGDGGNDTLTGGAASDFIYGLDGADTIKGGGGADHLTGGAGADIFVYDSLPATWGVDTIWDFTLGEDKLNLAGSGFTSFAQLTIQTMGADTVINGGNGGRIWLMDVVGVTASDFLFA